MKLKTFLRRALLLVIAGVAAFAAYQWWRLAHKSPVPEGIVFGNGRIESVQVDIAAKYGGRIKEIRVGRAIWSKQIRFSQRWTSVSLRPSSRMTRRSSRRPGGRQRSQGRDRQAGNRAQIRGPGVQPLPGPVLPQGHRARGVRPR